MTAQQLFRVHRKIKLRGTVYEPGDVVDLLQFDLPHGRAEQFVDQRKGEFVSSSDDVSVPDTAEAVIADWAVSAGAPEPHDEDVVFDGDMNDELSAPIESPTGFERAQLETMGVPALRKLAVAHGVAVRGAKTAIIDRLMGAGTPS